ncbi:MAG: hypothetical protein ACXWCR_12790, partial [Flavitalea sp.]
FSRESFIKAVFAVGILSWTKSAVRVKINILGSPDRLLQENKKEIENTNSSNRLVCFIINGDKN